MAGTVIRRDTNYRAPMDGLSVSREGMPGAACEMFRFILTGFADRSYGEILLFGFPEIRRHHQVDGCHERQHIQVVLVRRI